MFNGDRLNDDYERHKRLNAHRNKDEIEDLVAEVHVFRRRWYNGILSRIGDGLIEVGQSIKEKNADLKSKELPASMRQYETFPE